MKMKKIICSIALIAGSLLSTGIFSSYGDQFPEEDPWMIGRQEEMDNTNEEGAGATESVLTVGVYVLKPRESLALEVGVREELEQMGK